MKPREHIIWEVVLVLSSVAVFRSMWMLMDRVDILSDNSVLVAMFCVGLVLTVAAVYKLTHSD